MKYEISQTKDKQKAVLTEMKQPRGLTVLFNIAKIKEDGKVVIPELHL